MRESEVEDYFIWCVEMAGGKTYKFESPNHRGVADQIACLPDGSTWFVELKRPKGGRVSPLQQIFEGEMLMLNQKYARLKTKEEVDAWITGLPRGS